MYILPMLTHLEVVALGGSSDISPDQHLNYASNVDNGAFERGLPGIRTAPAGT